MAIQQQREGKLSPYTRGKGAQKLYWLIEGRYAISPRTLYYDEVGEPIADFVELFKARPDLRYASAYNFRFTNNASSIADLKKVCWHLAAYDERLLEVGEALESFKFGEPIDLRYIAPSWQRKATPNEEEDEDDGEE